MLAFTYSGRHELVEQRVKELSGYPGNVPGGDLALVIKRHYDNAGNLNQLDYTDQPTSGDHAFWYDGLGRLEAIKDSLQPTAVSWVDNTYDYLDQLRVRSFANGRATEIDYDLAGYVDEIRFALDSVSNMQVLDYTPKVGSARDLTGAVTRIDDDLYGESLFAYDESYQLTSSEFLAVGAPASDTETSSIVYDTTGNRQTVTTEVGDPATPPPTSTIVVAYSTGAGATDSLDQYATIDGSSQSYDNNGNLRFDGSREYIWSSENRLLEVKEGGATLATYSYDPFGRRISKSTPAADTWYFWDGNRLAEEHDATASPERRYVYADGYSPVMMEVWNGSSYERHYVHADHLDTPRLMSTAAGTISWSAQQDPFGTAYLAPSNVETLNIRFPGQYYDAETETPDGMGGTIAGTGLHYNRFRYYDPSIGRYISADPIGQAGGVNLYSYALNDPLNLIDPYGDAAVTVEAFAGIGGKATLGFDANGNFFASFGLGVGIGAGAAYDPCAQPAGFGEAKGDEPTATVSVSANAGIGAGSFGVGATKEAGVVLNTPASGFNDTSVGSPSVSLNPNDATGGVKAKGSASATVNVTFWRGNRTRR